LTAEWKRDAHILDGELAGVIHATANFHALSRSSRSPIRLSGGTALSLKPELSTHVLEPRTFLLMHSDANMSITASHQIPKQEFSSLFGEEQK